MNRRLLFNTVIVIVMFVFSFFLSIHYALLPVVENSMSDISAFYHASHMVLDPAVPNKKIYDIEAFYELIPRYGVHEKPLPFIYSIPAAYILSPLVLMPFREAKVAMNFVSLIAYVISIITLLRLGSVPARWFLYSIALSLAFLPFYENLHYLNTNALVLLLISLAVLAAVKERPLVCGFLIGIASLFKLFPLAIAMILGLKNWRIFIACALTFSLLLIISGSMDWFHAITHMKPLYTSMYRWLGLPYFVVYAIVIAAVTVYISYRGRFMDYPLLVSVAIAAVFLIMPIVEYHHLTLLAVPFVYMVTFVDRVSKWMFVALYTSFLIITAAHFFDFLLVFGILLLWMIIVRLMIHNVSSCKPAETFS